MTNIQTREYKKDPRGSREVERVQRGQGKVGGGSLRSGEALVRRIRPIKWKPGIERFLEEVALVEPLTFGHVAGFFISSDKAWISMPG